MRKLSQVVSGALLSTMLVSFGLTSSAQAAPKTANDLTPGQCNRIAVSADGNQHDKDDWGATPATLAIIAERNNQGKLVHYDFNSHLGDNNSNMARQMRTGALEGARRFGFNQSVFFDDQQNVNRAVNNLKNVINASSANNRLCLIVAGPMEVAWRGLNAATPNKRQFVRVISHSNWNNRHQDTPQMNHDWKDVQRLLAKNNHFIQIKNQNNGLNTNKNWSPWSWMENSNDGNLRWVYSRMRASGKSDISDAGMVYWLLNGDQNGNANKLRNYLQ